MTKSLMPSLSRSAMRLPVCCGDSPGTGSSPFALERWFHLISAAEQRRSDGRRSRIHIDTVRTIGKPRAKALAVAKRLECGGSPPLSDVQKRRQVARTPNAGAPSARAAGSLNRGANPVRVSLCLTFPSLQGETEFGSGRRRFRGRLITELAEVLCAVFIVFLRRKFREYSCSNCRRRILRIDYNTGWKPPQCCDI